MKHRPFIMLLMILSIVLLSGCWDRAELQDLDIVSAIGIDEGNDDVENRYQVTVQIVNEGQISGATQTGQAGMSPVTTYSATGSTISEAIRKIAPMAPQDLFFPHVQLMVIGEKMARNEGIQDLFDLIERDSQFRTLFPILIVRDHTAKTLLQITTPLESIPSTKIVGGLESSKKVWGEYASTRADQVIQQLNGEQANITGVVINGNPEEGNNLTNIQRITPEADVEIKGLAIFKKGKLKEWLEEDTARGATWINNELTETIVNLDCEKDKKGLAVDIMRSNAKIKSEIKNKKPVIHLTIRTEGHISEVHCPVDLSKHKTIEKLEKQLEKEIKEEVMLAIEAAKEQKADIFRFGETINRKDPKLWKKIEGKWSDEIFPETEVNVNIKAFIRRSGLRTKSYIK
ncbi:Ger(x)C family spore germination protein [Metabacillus rhizolycopersici]|uniref:Ger(X)C family spore germination protein n=1 Tax=Metabacillus rhizolycopersici TaxID=2875709 RepID=A0ABS7UTS7_9BACI|nr:Ger(x)C family spore germination protein [Metabacillus rhizolycopersici]MBZ5751715.1 Ger(x)C family spore germination protein [Metabacillus rhizolycopersici]